MLHQRAHILEEAKKLNNITIEWVNTRALIFKTLRDWLKNNENLRKEQSDRVENKKKFLTEHRVYQSHIQDIVNWKINLGTYQPNYENIERYFLQSRMCHIHGDESRNKFQQKLDSAFDKEKKFTKETFLGLCKMEDIYEEELLQALWRDFIENLKKTLSISHGLPEDLIQPHSLIPETYTPRANPFSSQTLYWVILSSKASKSKTRRSQQTRITINPIRLLEGFDLKNLFLAWTWDEDNKATHLFPLTLEVFSSTNGHLNGPTL